MQYALWDLLLYLLGFPIRIKERNQNQRISTADEGSSKANANPRGSYISNSTTKYSYTTNEKVNIL